ncbi:MAG: hypothetical protein OCC45_14100 [Desulfotalea sp.]
MSKKVSIGLVMSIGGIILMNRSLAVAGILLFVLGIYLMNKR